MIVDVSTLVSMSPGPDDLQAHDISQRLVFAVADMPTK